MRGQFMVYGAISAMVGLASIIRMMMMLIEAGSFPASCDPSRAYKDIPTILRDHGENSLLEFMENYWLVSISI